MMPTVFAFTTLLFLVFGVFCHCCPLIAYCTLYHHFTASISTRYGEEPFRVLVIGTTEITWFLLVPRALLVTLRATFSRHPLYGFSPHTVH